jgi:hypothetical protein
VCSIKHASRLLYVSDSTCATLCHLYHAYTLDVDEFLSAHRVIAPTFDLRVRIYSDTVFGKEISSFVIALPRMNPLQSTLFSKTDDCPSFRLPWTKNWDNQEGLWKRLPDATSDWQLGYAKSDTVQCLNAVTKEAGPIDDERVRKWNAQRSFFTAPPWMPLDTNQTRVGTTDLNQSRRLQVGIIKPALDRFLNHPANTRIWSRWLIVPQTAYGWDHFVIYKYIEQIYKEVPKGNAFWVDIPKISPSITLRLFSNTYMAQAYRLPMFNLFTLPAIVPLGIITLFIGYCTILVLAPFIYSIVFSFLLLPLAYSTQIYLNVLHEGAEDSIGMAWALKGWLYTGVPSSLSRSEALIDIKKRFTSVCSIRDDRIFLQRRSDGWYLLVGTREGDWLEDHREIIKNAIKNGTSGRLNPVRPTRSSAKPGNILEGDDAVGI